MVHRWSSPATKQQLNSEELLKKDKLYCQMAQTCLTPLFGGLVQRLVMRFFK